MAYLVGKGTTISHSTAAGVDTIWGTADDTYSEITQVESIDPPDLETDVIEIVHLASTYIEKRASIKASGEASMLLLWDPDDVRHAMIKSDFEAGTERGYRIALTDGTPTNIYFNAYVKSFGPEDLTVDSVLKVPVTLQLMSTPTIA